MEEIKKNQNLLKELKENVNHVKLKVFLKKHKKEILASKAALLWIIENIENIKEFIETTTNLFHSPVERMLDVDSLNIFEESFNDMFDNEKELYIYICKRIAVINNFQSAYSKQNDIYIDIDSF
ncbi:hypothetical protein [Marinifilum flexuosum]|uniref:Uncharacterized protein n=1 Tax=Marinifilum flexuosum TaxID=1117708 RepID=A0A419WF10_9BACT|nr:hypothetical protein [Marinifilum flexuosum]RKD94043.1 hypothetical protein BXY64_4307 [Marinifilum flexuosum]